jgi:hypothetical protein
MADDRQAPHTLDLAAINAGNGQAANPRHLATSNGNAATRWGDRVATSSSNLPLRFAGLAMQRADTKHHAAADGRAKAFGSRASAEQLQDRLATCIGDAERLNAKLLLDL